MVGALEELPGVLSAQVDLATKEVHVQYRRGEVTLKAMREATDRVDLRLRARHWFHRWLTRIRRGGP